MNQPRECLHQISLESPRAISKVKQNKTHFFFADLIVTVHSPQFKKWVTSRSRLAISFTATESFVSQDRRVHAWLSIPPRLPRLIASIYIYPRCCSTREKPLGKYYKGRAAVGIEFLGFFFLLWNRLFWGSRLVFRR